MRTKPASQDRRPARPAPEPTSAAGGAPHPRRVLLCERGAAGGTPIRSALQELGIEPVSCPDPKALFEEAVRQPPGLVICDLADGCHEDLIVLELFRRAAPGVPLILVASEGRIETRRLVLGLRPMYYIVGPVEAAEMKEAVTAALARRTRS